MGPRAEGWGRNGQLTHIGLWAWGLGMGLRNGNDDSEAHEDSRAETGDETRAQAGPEAGIETGIAG